MGIFHLRGMSRACGTAAENQANGISHFIQLLSDSPTGLEHKLSISYIIQYVPKFIWGGEGGKGKEGNYKIA